MHTRRHAAAPPELLSTGAPTRSRAGAYAPRDAPPRTWYASPCAPRAPRSPSCCLPFIPSCLPAPRGTQEFSMVQRAEGSAHSLAGGRHAIVARDRLRGRTRPACHAHLPCKPIHAHAGCTPSLAPWPTRGIPPRARAPRALRAPLPVAHAPQPHRGPLGHAGRPLKPGHPSRGANGPPEAVYNRS